MSLDRFKDAIVAIVNELIPERRYLAPARYRVQKAEGGKLTANPESLRSGLPPAVEIPIRGSILGGHSATKLKVGTSVIVGFAGGDPGDPFLMFVDDEAEPDETAIKGQTKATVDAPQVIFNHGALGVARMTDPVIAGPFPGTIVSGSTTVKAG